MTSASTLIAHNEPASYDDHCSECDKPVAIVLTIQDYTENPEGMSATHLLCVNCAEALQAHLIQLLGEMGSDKAMRETVKHHLRAGRYIEAIREYRARTGATLKTAKTIVDQMRRTMLAEKELSPIANRYAHVMCNVVCHKMGKAWRNRSNIVRCNWISYARSILGPEVASNVPYLWQFAACLYVACGWYTARGGYKTFTARDVPPRGWELIHTMTEDFLVAPPDSTLTRDAWGKKHPALNLHAR